MSSLSERQWSFLLKVARRVVPESEAMIAAFIEAMRVSARILFAAGGQVHGLPWLFVADASLFPRCSGVNPYLTVMGLADRVAQRARARAPELLAA